MEAKLKHLEFIQGVVNRLGADSFRMKSWSMALAAALFVLLTRGGNPGFELVTLVPVLIFWGLDGYFLWQERLFRTLYDHVRVLEKDEIDFSMDVSRFRRDRTWPSAMFSVTLTGFYGAMLIVVGIAIIFN